MALPDRIPCKCGDLIGELVLKQAVVEFTDETGKKRRVQPSEFENLGGRSAAKKWKTSIKVHSIAGFDNREIGQYLREELGVDINRGVFTPSVSAKPGSNPKPAATSKTAVAKLAVAVKAGLKVSKTQGRTASAPSKRPLEDRLKAQLSNAFVCYEVPTPSRIISAPGKMKKNMCMVSAWPEFVYQSSAEDASWSGVPKASPATSTQQHDDTGEMLGSTVKTMHSNGDNSVEFLHGRPCGSSFGILDLTKASYPALFCLARNSGSEHALLGGILNSEPQVPKGKESQFPGDTTSRADSTAVEI